MKLEELGYNERFGKFRIEMNLEEFEIARVVAEHKERYIVRNEKGEYDAEITGNLRFSAKSRKDFPAVGDWVALIQYDSDMALIHSVLPRYSVISRQAVGKFGEQQIIAVNVDVALIMQAVDRDFNLNRLERYLTIAYTARVQPVIVLTKTDLVESKKLKEILENINSRIRDVPVFPLSNATQEGFAPILELIKKGQTYCMLGSSGVGKSTLMNNLAGKTVMKTNTISASTNKGRHITSHRELIVLVNGGILIDNPGMREIGIADASDGLTTTFDKIYDFSGKCKFTDCTHTNETGCAVIEALEQEKIDWNTYENFLKMEREKEHFERSASEKRKKDKAFGKMLKNFKNDMQQISSKHNNTQK